MPSPWHKSCNEIRVVYSTCSTCHHCIGPIRVLITGMWNVSVWQFCMRFSVFSSNFFSVFRFWMIFSTVLRFLIGPMPPPKSLHLRSFMSIKKQRFHLAAFVRFRCASLLANILRDVKQMWWIVRFLHKSLTTKEPSVKDKMKLSMEYFDSEALIKQQEIGSFNIPPPPSWPKLPSNAPLSMIFYWRMLHVINECCRIWQSHLLVLLLLLGYFACKHVSTMRNFSF